MAQRKKKRKPTPDHSYFYELNKTEILQTEPVPAHKLNYDEALNQYKIVHNNKIYKDKYVQFCLKLEDTDYMKTISLSTEEILTTDALSRVVEYALQNKAVTYMTFAKFGEKANRTQKNVKSFHTFVIDFDFYHTEKYKEYTEEEMLQELQPVLKKYPYTAAFSSGRGLYIMFKFNREINCYKPQFQEKHKMKVNALLLELAEFGADVKCKDFSRVFKLAGTIHPKTKKMSCLIESNNKEYSYKRFLDSIELPVEEVKPTKEKTTKKIVKLKKAKGKKIKVKHLKKVNHIYLDHKESFTQFKKEGKILDHHGVKKDKELLLEQSGLDDLKEEYPGYLYELKKSYVNSNVYYQGSKASWMNLIYTVPVDFQSQAFYAAIQGYEHLNKCRIKAIEKFVDIRKGNIECRNNLLLCYAIQLWFAQLPLSDAIDKMLSLNKKFNEPYDVKEVNRIFNTVSQNTLYVKSRKFNLLYYPWTSQNFIQVFELTETELDILTCWKPEFCFGGQYSKKAIQLVKKVKRQAIKAKKKQKMLELLKTKSVKEVADIFNCSIQTVYNYIQASPKQLEIKREKLVLSKYQTLNYNKQQRQSLLGVSRSTLYRREKNLKPKTMQNLNTHVRFIDKFYKDDSILSLDYEIQFFNYILDNEKDIKKEFETKKYQILKSPFSIKNVRQHMFYTITLDWLLQYSFFHDEETLKTRMFRKLMALNSCLPAPLSHAECLDLFTVILKNQYNFYLGDFEKLHLPFWLN